MYDKCNSRTGLRKSSGSGFLNACYLDDCLVFNFSDIAEAQELATKCLDSNSGFFGNSYYCVDYHAPLAQERVLVLRQGGVPIPSGPFAVKKSLVDGVCFRDCNEAFSLELAYNLADKNVYMEGGQPVDFNSMTQDWYASFFLISNRIRPCNSKYLNAHSVSIGVDDAVIKKFRPLLVSGILPFATKAVFKGYANALRALGVQIATFEFDSIYQNKPENYDEEKWLQMIRSMLVGMCNDVRRNFTHVLFIDGLSIQPWVIGSIPQKKILISTEDPHCCDITHLLFPMYDYAFANDINASNTFGTYHLSTAYDSLENYTDHVVTKSDVIFVGAVYENRLPFLERCHNVCKKLGYKMVIVGPKLCERISTVDEILENKTVDQSEMACYIANSRICLNVFRNVDKCKLSNNSIFSVQPYDMSPRCFDAFGLGSLLITDYREAVKDFFTEDIVFNSGEEEGMLTKFLENEILRKEIMNEFRKKVVTDHTYLNRCAVLLNIVQKDFH